MTITAVIITKNEEKNIKKCLDSVLDIADEIIVLDSFSTDNTPSICETYPSVRFIQKMWSGYAGSKNFANEKAQSDYILSLDADEYLSKELKNSILEIKKAYLPKTAYQVNRLNFIGNTAIRYSGWYPDKKIRLFPKNESRWIGNFVHETLITVSHIQYLEGDLLHNTSESFDDWYQKQKKYAELGAQELFEQKKRVFYPIRIAKILSKFLGIYIFKLGFLDGYAGFKIAQLSAAHLVYKYKTLDKLRKKG